MKVTKFVFANLVMPVIVGIIMANLGNVGCIYYGHLLKYAPCWLVNFITAAFLTALVIDLVIYIIYPKIQKRSGLLDILINDSGKDFWMDNNGNSHEAINLMNSERWRS